MSGLIERLFAAIDHSQGLPMAERTAHAVINALKPSQPTHQNPAELVSGDLALTQQILQLANSPMYAPFLASATTVSQALQVVGTDALKHLVLGTPVAPQDDTDDGPLAKALLSADLARHVCPQRGEEAAISALFIDLGSVLLEHFLPDEFQRLRAHAGSRDLDTVATEVLGVSLGDIGIAAAKHWRLPSTLQGVLDGSGDAELIHIAGFSTRAAQLTLAGRPNEVAALAETYQLPAAARASVLQAVARRKSAAAPVESQTSASPTTRHLASEHVLSQSLDRLGEQNWPNVEALAGAMFPALDEALGTAHCLLFMLTRSGDFAIRYGQGKGIDALRTRLRVSADFKPTAFHAAIKNNVDVSIADVAKLRPTALPDGYHGLLPEVTKFLILPIAHQRVGGLLYCDWESGQMPEHEALVLVKRLRDLFLPFFPA